MYVKIFVETVLRPCRTTLDLQKLIVRRAMHPFLLIESRVLAHYQFAATRLRGSAVRGHLPRERLRSLKAETARAVPVFGGDSPGARDEASPSLCLKRPSTRPNGVVARAAGKYC